MVDQIKKASGEVVDSTLTVDGYSFKISGRQESLTKRNIDIVAEAFRNASGYLRLLSLGRASEPPVSVHLETEEEYFAIKGEKDFTAGYYYPTDNTIHLSLTRYREIVGSLDTTEHELEHAIDDMTYVDDDVSFASAYLVELAPLAYIFSKDCDKSNKHDGERIINLNYACKNALEYTAEKRLFTSMRMAEFVPVLDYFGPEVFTSESIDKPECKLSRLLSETPVEGWGELLAGLSKKFKQAQGSIVSAKDVSSYYASVIQHSLASVPPEKMEMIADSVVANGEIDIAWKVPFAQLNIQSVIASSDVRKLVSYLGLFNETNSTDALDDAFRLLTAGIFSGKVSSDTVMDLLEFLYEGYAQFARLHSEEPDESKRAVFFGEMWNYEFFATVIERAILDCPTVLSPQVYAKVALETRTKSDGSRYIDSEDGGKIPLRIGTRAFQKLSAISGAENEAASILRKLKGPDGRSYMGISMSTKEWEIYLSTFEEIYSENHPRS